MMIGLEKVMKKEKPDLVLLIGDTNSTLAAALTASRLNLTCAHLESGTRTFDKSIPEEINRIVADNVSDILFCPSKTAVENLKKEGFNNGLHNTGDIMIDLLLGSVKDAENKSDVLSRFSLEKKRYILATVHRQVNTNDKDNISSIFNALIEGGEKTVVPLHPRTRKFLVKYGLYYEIKSKLKIIEPLNYIDLLALEKNAKKIITDSGGMQKEAYTLKVPCITLDRNTGWVETVDDGWNVLVGAKKENIINAIKNFIPTGKQHNHYGNGDATEKIVNILKELK